MVGYIPSLPIAVGKVESQWSNLMVGCHIVMLEITLVFLVCFVSPLLHCLTETVLVIVVNVLGLFVFV